jgi:osmotically-inducible protein OsmY
MKQKLRLIVPAVVFGMAISIPAIAQDDSVPASQSMHQAGEQIEHAGSDAAAAAVDTYHGTKRAVKDTAITTKVKVALHNDKEIRHADADIDVDTRAGVVTLVGKVPSISTAQHAEEVAMQTEGVRKVNNELTVRPMVGSEE